MLTAEFRIFEAKLFQKLNILSQMFTDSNKSYPRRELFKCPAAISDQVDLPAQDIASLEKLDNVLSNEVIRKQMVSTEVIMH